MKSLIAEASGQRLPQSDVTANRRWNAELWSLYCAKCLAPNIDGDYFPQFVDELVARWREHDELYQEFINAKSWFARMLPLIECERFRTIELPNGEFVPLRLDRAKFDFQVRRKPSLVLEAPRCCSCKASGRRKRIEAFIAPTRRAAG
ncbi:hypothetical protein [Lacipirellula parvula]|nr:hypothetical protein [Lacipirellula parvula]